MSWARSLSVVPGRVWCSSGSTLLDMRIPLTFPEEDCQLIGEVNVEVVESVMTGS